jgi:BA14K-like protein
LRCQLTLVGPGSSGRLEPLSFCACLKQSFGLPPHRIERAKELLAERSVTEAALAVGFAETGSFSAAFRPDHPLSGVDQSPLRLAGNYFKLATTGGKDTKRQRGNSRRTLIKPRGVAMAKPITKLMLAALITVAVPAYAGIASAAPISGALAVKNAVPNNIENVYWRGGWGWRGRGWGWGVGAGIAAGALIGGALAAPYYYGGYYGGPYYASPYYADPYYVDSGYVDSGYYAQSYAGGGGVDYCIRRYRSYDPRSGTFLGNDGRRHPCP